jgi:hypothetical protein
MEEITVTFKCSLNQMALLMALYDLLQNSKPGGNIEDCAINTLDNYNWLLDEIADVAPEVVEILDDYGQGDDVTPFCRQVAERFKKRKEIRPPELPQDSSNN